MSDQVASGILPALTDLSHRMERAAAGLFTLEQQHRSGDEQERLRHKREGVLLARSYVLEAIEAL